MHIIDDINKCFLGNDSLGKKFFGLYPFAKGLITKAPIYQFFFIEMIVYTCIRIQEVSIYFCKLNILYASIY